MSEQAEIRTVAITGANGFVGRHLVRYLREHGFDCLPLVRTPSGLDAEIVVGQLEDASWDGPGVDAFVHLAGQSAVRKGGDPSALEQANVQGTRKAIELAGAARARRFVFLSSIKVHGETAEPDSPIRETSDLDPRDDYARSKVAAEELVRANCGASGMEWTIIRPPMVYGSGNAGNFASLMRMATSPVPLPLAGIENARSMIHVDNLADFIRHCLVSATCADEAFVVSDLQPVATSQLIRQARREAGLRDNTWRIPSALVRFVTTLLGRPGIHARLYGLLVVDPAKALATGWHPPLTFDEALRRTIQQNPDQR